MITKNYVFRTIFYQKGIQKRFKICTTQVRQAGDLGSRKKILFKLYDISDISRIRLHAVLRSTFLAWSLKIMFSGPFLIERVFNKDSKYVLPKCGRRGTWAPEKKYEINYTMITILPDFGWTVYFGRVFSKWTRKNMFSKPFLIEKATNLDSKFVNFREGTRGTWVPEKKLLL